MADIAPQTQAKPATKHTSANGPHEAPKTRKPRTLVPQDETKRDKFERVTNRRVNEILKRLDILITQGRNRSNYEYDNHDVTKIIQAIRTKVDALEATIQITSAAEREKFEV